jgi:RNA polymerase sigma-70 factor (ECF subfamily)
MQTDSNAARQAAMVGGDPAAQELATIARILAGERDLFHELIRPYERGLYVAAYSIVQNESDAEDAAQEAVIKAYKNLKGFRGEARFSTWLMAITINEARGRLRQLRSGQFESLDEQTEEQGDYTPAVLADWRHIPSEELERKELRQALQAAMAQLTAEQREVLILRDVRGMSIAETVAALGVNEALVKVRLFRARLAMQKLLAPALGPKPRGRMGWLTRKAGGR